MQHTDNIIGEGQHGKGPGPEVMGASTLTGDPVLDAAGSAIGSIREIMLDVPSGRIAYAVLAFEDANDAAHQGAQQAAHRDGPVRKLFAVPWAALRLDARRQCFVLEVDRERLRNAPGLDPDHWPSMAQPTWASALYEFYGVEPYWEE